MERAFAFDIAGNPGDVDDESHAGAAVDFRRRLIHIVRVVFRFASLGKLRRRGFSRAKCKDESHRSEQGFHTGTLPFTDIMVARRAAWKERMSARVVAPSRWTLT